MKTNITEQQASTLQSVFPSIISYNMGDGWNDTMGFTFSVNDKDNEEEFNLNCFLELEDLA